MNMRPTKALSALALGMKPKIRFFFGSWIVTGYQNGLPKTVQTNTWSEAVSEAMKKFQNTELLRSWGYL